ncbi:MAG: TIR domain-containing protein [Candidatus Acidiferrales bacterium]
MPRRIFFSFHYDGDILRVGQIRNSQVATNGGAPSGFIDKAAWESLKRGGEAAIKRWISDQLHGTSVTVVLIGSETANREWVNYEIGESARQGNGMLGVYIHNVLDLNRHTSPKGENPFDFLFWDGDRSRPLSRDYKTYDWISDDGRTNLPSWIEEAAQAAGR